MKRVVREQILRNKLDKRLKEEQVLMNYFDSIEKLAESPSVASAVTAMCRSIIAAEGGYLKDPKGSRDSIAIIMNNQAALICESQIASLGMIGKRLQPLDAKQVSVEVKRISDSEHKKSK